MVGHDMDGTAATANEMLKGNANADSARRRHQYTAGQHPVAGIAGCA